jgi:hypothetical protein
MTISLDLTPAQEAAITQRAEARGITPEQWVMEFVNSLVPPDTIEHLQDTDPEGWFRQLREWAESHDRMTPLLSDEALRRESIYEDRL